MRTANRRTAKIAPALLFGAITFLQPVPEARADISVQGKEVLEAVVLRRIATQLLVAKERR